MRRTDSPAKDVEHAGDILDRGRWVQFVGARLLKEADVYLTRHSV